MLRSSILIAAALAAASLLSPGAAQAQQDSMTLTDGSATFTLNNLRASRTGSGGGTGTFTTGSPPTNHMYQNWFWLSVGADTREYALSNQTLSFVSGNSAILQYDEPSADGTLPNNLRVTLQYTLHDLSTTPGRSDEAMLVIAWRATNRVPVILPYFSLFHYADFDAAGAASGDSAVIRGTDQQLQVITDSGSATSPPARIDYAASGGVLTGRQVGVYPSVRNLLTDGANSVLSNGLAPFGPGDYSGAFHWSTLALGPSEGNDTITGSVVIHITTRCKADYNENGSIGVNDIFAFLTDWFSGCP